MKKQKEDISQQDQMLIENGNFCDSFWGSVKSFRISMIFDALQRFLKRLLIS